MVSITVRDWEYVLSVLSDFASVRDLIRIVVRGDDTFVIIGDYEKK